MIIPSSKMNGPYSATSAAAARPRPCPNSRRPNP